MVAVATTGVVITGTLFAPYQFKVQVPACGVVPNGSVDVFEIARPVSNPTWFVTNGYNRIVRQMEILMAVFAVEVSMNRGTVAEELAVVTVLVGAKLRFTVPVPEAGLFVPGLATYETKTPN